MLWCRSMYTERRWRSNLQQADLKTGGGRPAGDRCLILYPSILTGPRGDALNRTYANLSDGLSQRHAAGRKPSGNEHKNIMLQAGGFSAR